MAWRLRRQQLLRTIMVFQAVILITSLPAAATDLLLSPRHVRIGAFFDGARVSLEAEIPPGSQAVVEVMGNPGNLSLMRKGRRGGLWMSVGEIEIDNTPNLYLVLSTSPTLPALTGGATPWGFDALESRLTFSGTLDSHEKDRFFHELIELKESEGLFGITTGALKIKPVAGGERVSGSFRLPAKVAPGEYQVRLSVIQDGKLTEQQTETIKVDMVGFPAAMAALAFNHAALYGLIAVLLAIAVGFLMGFMFKDKGGH
jgi:Putative transmembrane protein (Alph_Pro_TM)